LSPSQKLDNKTSPSFHLMAGETKKFPLRFDPVADGDFKYLA
jgi:hypothetical protein